MLEKKNRKTIFCVKFDPKQVSFFRSDLLLFLIMNLFHHIKKNISLLLLKKNN